MIDWDKYKGATSVDIVYRDGGVVIDTCRVNRPTQTKTVADAVEWANGKWPNGVCSTIWVDGSGTFRLGGEVTGQTICTRSEFEAYVKEQKKIDISEMREGMTVRCIRADSGCYKVGGCYVVGRDKDGYFGPLNEKCLASFNHQAYSFELAEEPEQEGEKWTHELWGDRAYIKVSEPDCDGYLVVVTEGDGYLLCQPSELKPIKPTISESEAWRKMHEKAKHNKNYGLAIQQIKEQYDII